MSDLDEAIREHLALKRLHGADPTEVARLEEEALGEVTQATARDLAAGRTPHLHLAEAPVAHVDEVPPREEIVPQTNEYAPASAHAYHEIAEQTQEYSVEEQIGWVGGPALQGGAA